MREAQAHPSLRPKAVQAELRSAGTPLDGRTHSDMRRALGLDFGDVRIHTGPSAEASTREVGARAFTVGRDVVFGAGTYAPSTSQGRGLLAHELTHVVQQNHGAGVLAGHGVDPDTAAERAAQGIERQVAGSAAANGDCAGGCPDIATTPVTQRASLQHSTMPGSAPQGVVLQRSACDDASRLRSVRAGVAAPAAGTAAGTTVPGTTTDRAESDAAWASAASTIDFALSILEHPVARTALGLLPIPVVVPPQTRELVREALPHVREIWELISDPVRLMTEVQGFVDAHLAGVPEEARTWLADAAFTSMRDTRHLVGVTLALGDAVAELLSNWTAPFVTAWHEFAHPLDVDAEMADLACIQERFATGEINTFEAYTAIYGWLLGWVNRYAVYVGIALVAGGAVVGALGGGGVGGAGGAAAGGVGAAPGAAAGGGGGAAAGTGAGWALSEEIGIGILVANAVHMLLQVVAAGERLADNDRAAADDARAGRTPSDAVLTDRSRHDEESYASIAHVLLSLGIMGALVLLAAFGSQFARVAVAGLSRRYPSLAKWLAEAGARFEKSRLGRAAEEFQSGRRSMADTLSGRTPPGQGKPDAGARSAAVETTLGEEPHRIQYREGRIHLCTDCAELDRRLARILDVMHAEHPSFDTLAEVHVNVRAIQKAAAEGTLAGAALDAEVRSVSARLQGLARGDRALKSLLTMELEQLDRLAAEWGDSAMSSAQPRVGDVADTGLTAPARTPFRPPGATPPPPPSATLKARREWLRERLQQHVDAARERFEVEGYTPNQEVDIRTNPSAAARHRGSRIDGFAKSSVMEDPDLATVICAPDYVPEPDFIGASLRARGNDWFDATTVPSWQAHLDKYRARYGPRGTLLDTGRLAGAPAPTIQSNL